MGSSIIGAVASLIVGAAVASASVVGLISSQTAAPDKSPIDITATSDQITYGE